MLDIVAHYARGIVLLSAVFSLASEGKKTNEFPLSLTVSVLCLSNYLYQSVSLPVG